jgi:pimeloyl-ACP methyl ester carboxylesterase
MVSTPDSPASQWADLDGPTHYVDYGGPAEGPRLVLVHGLGGSLRSWGAVAPALARVGRTIALDLPGFGRSPGSPRSMTLEANQRLLHRFLLQVAGVPAIVIGHSMGATIAAGLCVRHPSTTAGLVFVNAAVPWQLDDLASPGLTALAAALAAAASGRSSDAYRGVALQLLRLARARYERPSRTSPSGIERRLAAIRARIGDGQMNGDTMAAALSLTLTMGRRKELAMMLRSVKVPVLMLHGDRDKFVPVSAARATAYANPAWQFEIARGIGHVPQMEAPGWTADRITAWFDAEGAGAVRLAVPPDGKS